MQNTLQKTALAFLFLATSLNAQSFNEECGTKLTQENIEFIRKNDWFYNGKNNLMNHPKYGNLLNSTFLLPVTLHVIRTSAGTGGIGASQQTQGITDLNTYFTGTGIQFYQASSTHYINSDVYYSIDNDAERNAVRTANNVANTINLYVASYAQGSCGISSFTFSGIQGIVFDDDCYGVTSNPSTVPHEVGHYFELFHTHETSLGSELVNGSNCSISGDLLCDTPADPNLSSVVSVYPFCTYTGTATDGNGASYSPDTHNQMSYSQKRCRDSFSAEQIERMLAALVYLRNDELLVSPTISVNTASISKTLSTGSSTSQTVNISSTPTSSNLNWVATVSGASGPTATNQKTNNELNGSGGPDSFGYTWKDSNAPGGPTYVWNNISGTGTAIGNNWTDGNKDEGFLQTAIGFNFPFYGGTYNTVFISTNGFLTFSFYSAVTGTYTNPTIPTNDAVDNVISAFWD
ncbi:hypothetical protein IT568_13075, partial [bacterium]|nr:hypothetical protein [bacterium]